MYKNRIVAIMIVTIFILTSVVMAEKNTFEKTSAQNKTVSTLSPPQVEWEHTYGGTGCDWIYFVREIPGGYIACGNKGHPDEDAANPCVWKLDWEGNLEWELITTEVEYPRWGQGAPGWVELCSDGGYIVGVQFNAFEESLVYGILWKISADGTTEWVSKQFQGEDEGDHEFVALPTCIYEVADGYIVGGYAYFLAPENLVCSDGILMKIDKNGNDVWYKTLIYDTYDSGEDLLISLYPTSDGGYILAGATKANLPAADVWLVKTDATGNIEWQKTYGGDRWDGSYSKNVYQTSDGGYIIYALTLTYGAGKGDAWIIKTDANGEVEWTETYGENTNEGTGEGLDLTSDGGYVFVVTRDHSGFGAPRGDIWVNKIDEVGNVQWSLTFGTEWEDRAYHVQQTADGGYIISGAKGSSNSIQGWDGWLIKLSPGTGVAPPEMTVKKPRAGYIFLFDILGFPFPFTQNALVLGDLTFDVDPSDPNGISKVEFFIDGQVVETVTEAPYTYEWMDAEKGTYDVKIRAYNTDGATCKEELTIQKIF